MIKDNEYLFKSRLVHKNDKTIDLVYDLNTDELVMMKSIKKPCNSFVYQQILNHPHQNISHIYRVEEDLDQITVIEKVIKGVTLDELICTQDISEEEISKITLQLCDGLSHLHKLNPPIVHRDVKPENIMIDKQGNAILIDFDISRNHDMNKRKDTQILGSIGYAAPEQFGFGQSDAKVDIYALGVLLNVMVTKKYPNEEKCKGTFSKIVKNCIEIDAKYRYANCDEIKNELLQLGIMKTEIKNKTSKQKSPFRLPGFRQGKIESMIIATFLYSLLIYMMCTIKFKSSTGVVNQIENTIMIVALFCWLVITIFVLTDYLNCFKNLVKHRFKYKITEIFARLAVSFVCLFIVVIIGGIINSIF